jgi:hypothetical protein
MIETPLHARYGERADGEGLTGQIAVGWKMYNRVSDGNMIWQLGEG